MCERKASGQVGLERRMEGTVPCEPGALDSPWEGAWHAVRTQGTWARPGLDTAGSSQTGEDIVPTAAEPLVCGGR